LHIDINVQIPIEFKLIDSNIHTTKKISYLDAILGTTIDVKTLYDTIEKLKIPSGTQSDQIFIIRGKGVPQFQSNNIGDMYVRIQVEIPKVISEKEKKLLEEVKNEKQK
jgi:molecular chaperone DnaJ